jgi:ABC-type nitrate/sulfonate/bicarbonate transport system substrate-binding protein
MKFVGRICAILMLLNISSLAKPAESAAPAAKSVPLKLRIAYVAPVGVMAPVWMAAESGAFKAEGLEVELIYIEARSAIAALIAKEVDVIEISAPGMIPAGLAGADVTMIAGLLNKMIFSFHAQKEIKSAEQLRGKVIGTDRVGTPSDYGSRVALTLLGIKPESEVQLLRIGGSAALWPALQSGQIAGATLSPPQSFKADALGFARLVNTYHLPYQNVGVVVRKADIEPKFELWARLLRALREAIHRWYDDARLAKEVLSKYTKERDPEMLHKTYEFFTTQAGFNKELVPTDQGIQQILNFLGSTTLPSAKDAPPVRFYDTRILNSIRK